jgi:hypothetical protein
MTICGGCEVDTPPNRAWSAAKFAGMPQQIEVRAVHEVAAAAAQTNGAAAQPTDLPSTSPECSGARTELWRSGGTSSVQASRRGRGAPSEPAALLRGQGIQRPSGSAARQGFEQAACRFSAHGEAVVERDFLAKRSGRSASRRTRLDRAHRSLSIRRQCQLLGGGLFGRVPDAGAWHDNDLALMRQIDELFTAWPFLGSRRMSRMLRGDGRAVNRKGSNG